MIGSRFVETFKDRNILLVPDLNVFDMTRIDSVAAYFKDHPDIGAVINFAAYTNVSEAQKQRGDKNSLCYQVNVIGTQNLVEQTKGTEIYLIHISTDMVFPGDASDPGPYAEDHAICIDQNRLTWYGYTKALAEKIVTDGISSSAILRTICPVVKKYDFKADYLRVPLVYYEKNQDLYPIFSDQRVNITDVNEICHVLNILLDRRLSGIFHAACRDLTTPYEVMTTLFQTVYGTHDMVKPGLVVEFLKKNNDPTRYPQFGGLSVKATEEKLGVKFSTYKEIIQRLYE